MRILARFLTLPRRAWRGIPAARIRLLLELRRPDPRLCEVLRVIEKAGNRDVLRPVVVCQMGNVLGQHCAGAVRDSVLSQIAGTQMCRDDLQLAEAGRLWRSTSAAEDLPVRGRVALPRALGVCRRGHAKMKQPRLRAGVD